MKILVDMNLSPDWIDFLTSRDYEAVHWSKLGSAKATDFELMKWASDNGHIVLTADLDFGAILAATAGNSPSVVQLRDSVLTPAAAGDAVVRTLRQEKQALLDGALISIDTSRARLRVLPLKTP